MLVDDCHSPVGEKERQSSVTNMWVTRVGLEARRPRVPEDLPHYIFCTLRLEPPMGPTKYVECGTGSSGRPRGRVLEVEVPGGLAEGQET